MNAIAFQNYLDEKARYTEDNSETVTTLATIEESDEFNTLVRMFDGTDAIPADCHFAAMESALKQLIEYGDLSSDDRNKVLAAIEEVAEFRNDHDAIPSCLYLGEEDW